MRIEITEDAKLAKEKVNKQTIRKRRRIGDRIR